VGVVVGVRVGMLPLVGVGVTVGVPGPVVGKVPVALGVGVTVIVGDPIIGIPTDGTSFKAIIRIRGTMIISSRCMLIIIYHFIKIPLPEIV
jgi:hypothetical protein